MHVNNVGIMNLRTRKFRGPKGKEIKRLKIEGHDENSNILKNLKSPGLNENLHWL